jgi:twinkle protein
MGKVVIKNQPCLNPKCGSHDARQIYEDKTSFCFSCKSWFKPDASEETVNESPKAVKTKDVSTELKEIFSYSSRGFKDRGITTPVCEFYGVKVSFDHEGNIDHHYYPYGEVDGTCYKVRKLPKTFTTIGTAGGLFGKNKFQGGGKRLVITEGEIDALSVAQASFDKYKKFYPVISLPSSSGTKQVLLVRDWIRSFQEVVLCLDEDEAGKKALDECIKIIGIDKVKITKLPCKDANEVLLKHGSERLLQCIWDATQWSPAGIIQKDELWKALTEYNSKESIPYPECLSGVNTKLKGMREGEIALFISGTGSGKSTIMREIELHLLETVPTAKCGIVSLEESPAETARKLSGMAINRNPANEEISIEDLKPGFDKVFGDDRVILLDHQGSIKDSSIVDKLEYMALMGCTHLFIDHITILVSEGSEGLTGNEAIDKVMNDLLRLVKKHPVWVGLVSHLRKAPTGGKSFEDGRLPSIDDIRGSGSIKQVSFDIIAFARNMTAEEDIERNTIIMSVLKSRYTGLTGPVTGAYYNYQTGRLGGIDTKPMEQFDVL